MATTIPPSSTTPSSTTLRAELKEWERAFADANGGRKADRSDIKKVPEIAAKYKEYSRLKALETSSSTSIPTNPTEENARHHKRKRKHTSPHGSSDNLSTPRKKTDKSGGTGAFETPSRKSTSHPAEVDPYDSPSVLRRLFSPSTHLSPLKAAIGPTPQRDGKALGLFDLLSESGGSTATPSATRIAGLKEASVRTPSRRRRSLNKKRETMDTIAEEGEEAENDGESEDVDDDDDDDESSRLGRTPTSSGKKWMLSTLFATPTTWRYATMMDDGSNKGIAAAAVAEATAGGAAEGASVAAVDEPNDPGSETPSFLRRSTSGRYDTSNITGGLSPMATRKRPQFVGKGLSALVKGLRDMEEEQLEDDMDVLREIEAEQAAMMDAAQVADSQAAAENEGAPVWKKKGQKRTTRKVRMKPVVSTSRQAAPELPSFSDEEEEDGERDNGPDGGVTAVRETQQLVAPGPLDRSHIDIPDFDDLDSLHTMSEPDLSDFDPDYDEGSRPREKGKSFSEKMKEAIAAGKPPATETPEKPPVRPQAQAKDPEPKQPRARKVNPEAHANYRSLKIRNKNFKGRGGGRFGRRR
ncbi:hypothetical protein ASPACDRAFT_29674 [Aspergillus aculeatus ATCC 16872]|uniref:DNA replication regulator SLD2 n=1 Tax=Aspergillus aculeatus (strain ATCC 16872 / CBS 172.66 / WB 5094) TaxID=690307 RepID=A0A1L9WT29_ASPA1|nr:uncharacterized protein ASPACDRAFT_29674 [Aspergillus aculeatus ATCC 16872]OJJ99350.1 hypothetical protein ASPACDRAFT_29674 [Aspergillus aculeatus ATCC 16872]